jgi:hypothetical protein
MNPFKNTIDPTLITSEQYFSMNFTSLGSGMHYFTEIAADPDGKQHVIKHQGTARYLAENRRRMKRTWMTRNDFITRKFPEARTRYCIVITDINMRPIHGYPVAEEVIGNSNIIKHKQFALRKSEFRIFGNPDRLSEVPPSLVRSSYTHRIR